MKKVGRKSKKWPRTPAHSDPYRQNYSDSLGKIIQGKQCRDNILYCVNSRFMMALTFVTKEVDCSIKRLSLILRIRQNTIVENVY